MTFELYLDLTWQESRLIINDTHPAWEPSGTFMGSTNFVPQMWLPDIQIYMCKQFRKRQIVTDVAGLIIFKNRKVLYTVSTEVIIACPMKFAAYPLDHQTCKFLVGSYIHDADQIMFTGSYGHDIANQRAQQYELLAEELDYNDTFIFHANRTFSQTGFQVQLRRRRTPVLLQVYLTTGLFVIVSWISFIVPPEVVPGRMALLVTLFLVLVNIFNSVTGNAPKAEGLTAVETWVVSCIIHVFGVLAEYALILKIIQSEKRRDAKARRAFLKVLNNSNGISEPSKKSIIRRDIGGSNAATTNMQELFETEPLTSSEQNSQLGKNQHDIDRQWTNHQRDSRCVREKIQMAYERVDRIAMYLFPAIFFVFNLLYWTYYLIVVNV